MTLSWLQYSGLFNMASSVTLGSALAESNQADMESPRASPANMEGGVHILAPNGQ